MSGRMFVYFWLSLWFRFDAWWSNRTKITSHKQNACNMLLLTTFFQLDIEHTHIHSEHREWDTMFDHKLYMVVLTFPDIWCCDVMLWCCDVMLWCCLISKSANFEIHTVYLDTFAMLLFCWGRYWKQTAHPHTNTRRYITFYVNACRQQKKPRHRWSSLALFCSFWFFFSVRVCLCSSCWCVLSSFCLPHSCIQHTHVMIGWDGCRCGYSYNSYNMNGSMRPAGMQSRVIATETRWMWRFIGTTHQTTAAAAAASKWNVKHVQPIFGSNKHEQQKKKTSRVRVCIIE